MLSLSKSVISTSSRHNRGNPLRTITPGTQVVWLSTSRSWRDAPQFPFPSRRNATPHEIFHLPRNATEADIKARYFDLVRLYHPDKASDLSADASHARFQAITRAYDILRGKSEGGGTSAVDPSNPNVDLRYQTTAAWRAANRRRQQDLYSSGAADDKWKDRIILFGVISTVVFAIANTFTMADALNQSRELGSSSISLQERQQNQQRQLRTVEESRLSAEPEP